MNLNDINGAVEDLIGHHGHQSDVIVYLHGEKYGITGIDAIDGKLYVLSSDGKPAVSNVEYERVKAENKKYEDALSKIAHGDTWVAYPHDIAAWALGLEKGGE